MAVTFESYERRIDQIKPVMENTESKISKMHYKFVRIKDLIHMK